MVAYKLDHLTQPDSQAVVGPIQDDEALFLFALIRVMRLRRVLEIGGLDGYSARNWCEAVGPGGKVYTIDLNPLKPVAANHVTIKGDARHLNASHLGEPLDLIFFDCHVFDAQTDMLRNLQAGGIVTERTLLAFHDTNLHPTKGNGIHWGREIEGQWMHQDVERRMVNELHAMGWDALVLGTTPERHDASLPARHGLVVMQRFRALAV